MQNLKIKVNSEAESKEAQELFFELGFTWSGNSKGIFDFDMPEYIVNWNNGYLTVGDHFDENRKEITLTELRSMVNKEQDEPFITPETTLNDQYAEIEQVRQQSIEATLAERQSTYGNFEDVAFVTENIMSVLGRVRVNGLSELPNTHRMALYMIASKMARIVNGDFNHLDGWHDIGGYAKLVEDLIKENNNG